MKGLKRSKLVLTVITLMLLIGAIAIPLSGNILGSHAQSSITITPTNITGKFFSNPNNSGQFDSSQPLIFSQSFQAINFNPDPSQQQCNPGTNVDNTTRPFTDVYPATSPNGPCQTVIAQNSTSTEQAGVNDLQTFQAGFLANLTVPSAGTMTTSINSDDGFIFSVGAANNQQPTGAPGNPLINAPNSSPLSNYQVIAANNQPTPPSQQTFVTNFPAAGTYPMELDYTECCGGTLTLVMSNSFTQTITPTPPPTKTLFVLIGGLSSELKLSDINKPVGFEGLEGFLKNKGGFGSADFMAYSYPVDLKGQNQGSPHAYGCVDTFDHTLNQDVRTLHLQILNYLGLHTNQSTNIYLIGDSLGGVIGFGYLGLLKSMGWPSLPNGQLKGVITLDAPLGGIPLGDKIVTNLVFKAKCIFKTGPLVTDKPLDELVSVFNTTNNSKPLGGMAKLAQVVFPKVSLLNGVTNQMLADEAAKLKTPIHVLTIGNTRDFGFVPAMCQALQDRFPVLFLLLTNFESSQFVSNQKPPSGVYGREIAAGNPFCSISIFFNQVNHGDTLTNSDVENGIVDFINNNNPKPLMAP